MGEDFAFENQVCIILHNFAIVFDFDTFSRYRGCIAPFRFTRPPRTGDDGVAFENQVCKILHKFAIVYDFDTFF